MKKKIIFIVVGLVLIGLAAGAWYIMNRDNFRLVSTSPQDSGVTYGDDSIIFYFNKNLKPSTEYSVGFSSQPTINGTLYTQGDSLVLDHLPFFNEGEEYTIELTDVQSADGKTIDSISLSFTVELSEQQKFIQSLPYYSDGYSINYVFADQSFFVQISEEPINTYEDRAAAYLRGKGFNLDIVNVTYEPIRSLQGWGAPALDTTNLHDD